MASVALVPRAEQDIRTALNVLALNFSLNDKVVEELLKVGVRNLEEFRFLFEDEAKVGAFVAKIGLGDEATIQTARLRRAWTATRVYFSQVEQDRSKVALADLDSLLEESELRDAKQAFWRRYRLRFPAKVRPSDAVVSRVSRELSRRMLCLFNVWKPGRFHGIWVMASPAPARCGVTATPRAFQTCPWQISFASPRTIWHAASSLPSSRPWQTEVGAAFGKTRCVVSIGSTGLWQDTVYSACCFMGARCKAQRLRRNIDEIAQWPALHCHHTHAADEWQPYLQDGQRVFPSKEEAEYTWRSSTCPVSPLWKPQAGGNIGCRLIPGPSGSGQWHLQLSLWGCAQLTRKRGQGHLTGHAWWMSSWKTSCHTWVYVGRGHHGHRLPVTKWSLEPTTAQPLCEARKRWLVHQVLHHRKAEVLEIVRRVKRAKRSHCRLLRPIRDDCAHRRGESGHRGQRPAYLPGCTSLPLLLGPSWRASDSKTRPARASPSQTMCISQSQAKTHPVNSAQCWLPLNRGCWPVLRKASRPGRCLGRRPGPHCSHLGSLASWLEQTSHCRRSSHP